MPPKKRHQTEDDAAPPTEAECLTPNSKRKRDDALDTEESQTSQAGSPQQRDSGEPATKKGRRVDPGAEPSEGEEEQPEEGEIEAASPEDPNERWILGVLEDTTFQALAKETQVLHHEYEAAFARIAHRLMNETVLVLRGRPHRILEVECYYSGGKHHDAFCSGDERLQNTGHWWFYKSPWQSGSYKAFITIGGQVGSDGKRAFGGVLIRAIEPLVDLEEQQQQQGQGGDKPPELIEGPARVVTHMMRQCDARLPHYLGCVHFDASPAAEQRLYLAPIASASHAAPAGARRENIGMPTLQVWNSPRVGLTIQKEREDDARYVMKAYRFFVHPMRMKEGKVYAICAMHLLRGMDAAAIQQVTKTGKATIEKQLQDFAKGQTLRGDISTFRTATLNVGQTCQLYGALSHLV